MAELPVADFLRQRMKEYDSKFEVRKGSAWDDLFFKSLQFILQPLRDETDQLFVGQSLRRILQQEDPDAFDEELVDDLVANVFVYRITGDKSSGVARIYYAEAVYREWPANGVTITGNNSKNYTNPAPYLITQGQMGTQIEDGLYYLDIPVTSEDLGEDTSLDPDSLVTVVGDPDYVSVTNKAKIIGGKNRETNTALIERARRAITVRDLVTGKGFEATLFENFPTTLTEVRAIGFGDEEMMRDIVYNTHIGGMHDGYVKTPYIITTFKDFLGVLIDPTRATRTTTQLQLTGTNWESLGESNVDRSVAQPIVTQVKSATPAILTGTADLTIAVNLSVRTTLRIMIDSVVKEIRVAGLVPSSTSRNEIITNINNAFGRNVAFAYDKYIQIISPNPGLTSNVTILDTTDPGKNACLEVLGIPQVSLPISENGDGPLTFIEDDHYKIDNENGQIQRVLGAEIIGLAGSFGEIDGSPTATDIVWANPAFYPGQFLSVIVNDVITITGVSTAIDGDYRVVEWIDTQTIRLDATFNADIDLAGKYIIRRTGIKDQELVFVEFYFNPLSIDIGKYIKLDTYGRTRGIRPGREEYTISDVAFLRVNSIEVIDPVSGEPLGQVLEGVGGYGRGGYGEGPYGIGAGAEYRLVVNEPTARFSAFEDSYIVIASAYQGFSLRVTYDYVPEIETFHNFCRSDSERVLDGDILIKHFIPAYVSGVIQYSVDSTDSSVPDNDTLTTRVKDFINTRMAGSSLQLSDVSQFILKNVDPYYRYGAAVRPFTLTAVIHNTDATTAVVSSSDTLVIPKPDPFPKDTPAPLSPRIAHWIADNIVLERL